MRLLILINLIFFSSYIPSAEHDYLAYGDAHDTFQWEQMADSSIASLNVNFWNAAKFYNNSNPDDGKFNYWPQAHALDVLVDAYARTGKNVYIDYMNAWYTGVNVKNGNTFLNEFYDDMEWNALAMHRAYKVTHDKKWLNESVTLWNDIKNGWNDVMSGGIAWRKTQTYYKNTPANAPAAILAARLYNETKDEIYLTWAKKIYTWEKSTLVNKVDGLVYDGTNANNDGKLQDDPGWRFAYNQGVFIGAALELYAITKDKVYLNDALRTADHMIIDKVMSPDGIMRASDNGDGGLFNGIGVRYLTLLTLHPDIPSSLRNKYITFLKRNAETLWLRGTDRTKTIFSNNWRQPPGETAYLTPQLSGCMLMESMALLARKNYLK
jgi:predicted alpha-1,6-mannanase (GH76 family)